MLQPDTDRLAHDILLHGRTGLDVFTIIAREYYQEKEHIGRQPLKSLKGIGISLGLDEKVIAHVRSVTQWQAIRRRRITQPGGYIKNYTTQTTRWLMEDETGRNIIVKKR